VLTLTYEYKARPTDEQIQLIEHTLDVCRKVWNFALRERKDWINSRKCPINACSIMSEYIISADKSYPKLQCSSEVFDISQSSIPRTKDCQRKECCSKF
jgi:putative transposase